MSSKPSMLVIAAVIIAVSIAVAVQLGQPDAVRAADDAVLETADPAESDIMDEGVINVKAGEEFRITLRGNVTTGFHWFATSYDGLRLVRDWYATDVVDGPPRCGVGGKHTFVFSADEAGTYRIVLDYARQWEGHPIETETYTVTVE